jgi:site-specific DNA recombinase
MSDTRVLRWILYIRLSEVREEDLNAAGVERTFADREAKMRERVAMLGGEVVKVIRENDRTARNGKMRSASAFKRKRIVLPNGDETWRVVRAGFTELLTDLKRGVGNAIMSEDLDRLMRDPYDAEDLMQIARLHKLTAKSLAGAFELTDGGNDGEQAMARLLVMVANKSSADTGRRVAAGRARKAKNGEWGGGRRPFGFRVVGKYLEIDPVEAKIIRDCCHKLLRDKPMSLIQLAASLRERKVPTVSGGKWNPVTLRQMLLRHRNAGIEIYRGEEIGRTHHKPIIPEATYREVVRLLTDPKRTTTSGGRACKWLGSGIYLCGRCGGVMYVSSSGTGRRPRYMCKTNGHLGRLVSHVDPLVTAALFAYVSEARQWGKRMIKANVPKIDVGKLQSERTTIARRLDRLAEDYTAERVSHSQLLRATDTGRARIADIDTTIRDHLNIDSAARVLIDAANVEAAFEALPMAERREVLRELLSVVILPVGRIGRAAPDAIRIMPAGEDRVVAA